MCRGFLAASISGGRAATRKNYIDAPRKSDRSAHRQSETGVAGSPYEQQPAATGFSHRES